ncbi:unnamed protein product [Rhizophagus irregularis]|uniref:Uncharacterized protein n=1 Tax=Rhizophagus irregularis TaxID=588596 RepID=A0A2N1NBB4_9GLOM|nr:hypothetical protein RhiirC2_849357 [Rhizophagus irregularis]CAB4376533.1 unnamed protein product [Rhizophagus irregularis]CAB5369739.1 unnamed protein product [Rhizophagus irregularis]
MKFHIYLTLAIILFATALVPAAEGYHAKVKEKMIGECKIWVTDLNGKYVAGDKKFHPCNNGRTLDIDTKSKDKYMLRATTIGEIDAKIRGPFNTNTCYIIEGNSGFLRLEPSDDC